MTLALRAVRHRVAQAAIVLACGSMLLAAISPAIARDHNSVHREIPVTTLPHEARDVLARIRAGGPFGFERDGVAFGNRERLLPLRTRGFYHEYTVVTPGVRTRGARRIVCGGARLAPEVCYYTDDHYASFRRIRE